jgi:Cysteine-rich secretory protein family
VTAAINAWANQSNMYNYTLPTGFSEATGEFTQLVWKATTEVGCAASSCGSQMLPGFSSDGNTQVWFFICEYAPAGNIIGNNNQFFEENVQQSIC